MINLAISGGLGRMGQAITRLALNDNQLAVTCLLEHKDHPKINETVQGIKVTSDLSSIKGSSVLIDFTLPEPTMQHIQSCLEHGLKMVIGTTGLSDEQISKIKEASKTIPIVYSSNMSIGVNLLFKLTKIVAGKTGQNYSFKISESHHIHKKDAPSGTAKTIAQIAEAASGNKVKDIDSIREGEIVGDHTIEFESDEDILTLSHHAKSRDIFAKGSLVAAKFLNDKQNGLYTMQDVLGLN